MFSIDQCHQRAVNYILYVLCYFMNIGYIFLAASYQNKHVAMTHTVP